MKWLARWFGQPDSGSSAQADLGWLPIPHELVPGKQALSRREALLGAGATPLVMGTPEDLDLLRNLQADGPPIDVASTLALANAFDLPRWLKDRESEDPEFYSMEGRGEWPKHKVPATELSLHLELITRRPKPHVVIGIVPTANSWEVPAHLGLGGWNDCPEAHIHVALHKRWQDAFGSNIACISGDVIECTVERPPSSREEALALALEHCLYCQDIVTQGTETLENLAASLMASKAWYFWWD